MSGSSTSSTADRGAEDADLAGLGVDPDVDVLVAGDAAIGGLDAVLHRVDQLLSGDLLLGVELEEGTDEIATHDASSLLPISGGPTKRNVGVTHVTERPFSSRESIHPERWTAQTGARAWPLAPRIGPRSSRPGATLARPRRPLDASAPAATASAGRDVDRRVAG